MSRPKNSTAGQRESSAERRLDTESSHENPTAGENTPKSELISSKPDSSELMNSWVPTAPRLHVDKANDPMHLTVGEMYSDFFIRKEIGRGAFGVVYLAEQLSLQRTVALKVTDMTKDNGCSVEGQTMAQLEHPSIVRVFAEFADEEKKRRLLCMQYVAGINLRTLIGKTKEKFGDDWDGSKLLSILDEAVDGNEDVVIRETSVADREVLERSGKMATVCWLGAEAAFALDHAHRAGFIHHDVKPENTIIDRFGRPMLVDFNLALESKRVDRHVKGGTLPYMSPESLCDFSSTDAESANVCDADIYALGVMIWEFACGKLPFDDVFPPSFSCEDGIQALLDSREATAESNKVNWRLANCLRTAFEFDAKDRYPSAKDFGHALLGVAQQDLAIKERRESSWLRRMVLKRPVLAMALAAFIPHVVASSFQIAYNQAEIVSRLSPQANQLFEILLFSVNPVIYGFCAIYLVQFLFSVFKTWKKLVSNQTVDPAEVELARKNLLLFPRACAIVGALGWLAGAFGFPGLIYLAAEKFPFSVWLHFGCSFLISGAIGITFSYALVMAVAVYSLYPVLFIKPQYFVSESNRQLKPVRARLLSLSYFAGLIPLAAAILLVCSFSSGDLLATETNKYQELSFKGLVVGLILSSVFGVEFVRRVGKSVVRIIDVCIAKH